MATTPVRARNAPTATAWSLLLLASLTALPTRGQTFGEVEERRSTSRAYFVHVLPGEATMTVSVWGTVALPGVYEVGVGTSVGDVLSLAGGPLLPPLRQTSETETTREVRVRVYQTTPAGRAVSFDAPLDSLVTVTREAPRLGPGDVVEVQTVETEVRRRTWRDTATIASLASSGLVALLQLLYITTR